MKKKDELKNTKGLTPTQQNIIRLRTKLNKEDPNAIKPFTKYKIFNYFLNILCPPLALYRVWKKASPFSPTEKIAQTGVCVIYMFVLFVTLKGI